MSTQKTRQQFLDYFAGAGHTLVPSSPVVPHDDPTLLFVNAGMNQFKDVFLGTSQRSYRKAATSQKCIRAGGKHNDLENVGHTSRHLTFFEMLGNFSFGDYFKEQAIEYAWEVATTIYGFNPKQIWATVFREDDEAAKLWLKHVPQERICRMDEADNFWAMGDTGPCGPCSELYLDRGPAYGDATSPANDTKGDRFIEFWNLVFMQYDRDASGRMTPLPRPCIDTGSGLERVMMLQEGKDTLFEAGVLRRLITAVEEASSIAYVPGSSQAPAFHVVADHLRSLAFAIADGAQPSNVERGYVLRKILRRAVRYGRQLGFERPFLADLLPTLISEMGDDYPEIRSASARISEICTLEEEAFLRTLRRGGNLLAQIVQKAESASSRSLSGDDAFKLKDTYGLPLDEILLIASDYSLQVDTVRYDALEKEAREKSRAAHKTVQQTTSDTVYHDYVAEHGATAFIGYEKLEAPAVVTAIFVDGQPVPNLSAGQSGMVVLDSTPFYAEKGGQMGDQGLLTTAHSAFSVADTQSPYTGVVGHIGTVTSGKISLGQHVDAAVDITRRQRIARNHTATHLLHWALCEVLGPHIRQAGSVVMPDRLRFDFSHHKALSAEEIRDIERRVNKKIRANLPISTYELSYEDAQKRSDIKQFFGDKYGPTVRVVDIDFSKELCGGTHTGATGNIGYCRIAKEGSIAAGVRRLEAVTGEEAEGVAYEAEAAIDRLATLLKTPIGQVEERIARLAEENDRLKEAAKGYEKAQLTALAASLASASRPMGGTAIVIATVAIDPKLLRDLSSALATLLPSVITLLAATADGRSQVLATVSKDLVARGVKASDLVAAVTAVAGGKGGGKADMAQAGVQDALRLPEGFAAAQQLLEGVLC